MKHNPLLDAPAAFDTQLASFSCYILAVAVLVLGFWRMFSVELSEVQFLLGSLLVLNLSVMSVVVGLILPFSVRQQELATAKQSCNR